MIFVIGTFFWVLAIATVGRLLYASRAMVRTYAWQWGLLALIAISLLFRPHEDIFGGEDPGSYLNSGVTYGRQGSLFYVDPLLAQVPLFAQVVVDTFRKNAVESHFSAPHRQARVSCKK